MMLGWLVLTLCMAGLLWVSWETAWDRATSWRRWIGLASLLVLWAVTGVVFLLRFTRGLGPTTNMTDQFPWGIWIGLIQSGVALSGGGFVMAAAVHVFHIKRFESILRPSVLTAFLGYNFVGMSLFIEVGRPYRLWHPLAMWQHHSIMFEVAWCVTLYMTVLALEFSPVVFEHFGFEKAKKFIHEAIIPLVIAGVLLSSLHQSSMGSMFLLLPQKIDPLWHSPLLPVFFLISSVAVGMCTIIVESFFASRVFQHSLPLPLMRDLGRTASYVLVLYLGTKIVDLTARGAWSSARLTTLQGLSFWVEMGLGVVLPLVLLVRTRFRAHTRLLVGAAVLTMGGVVLNRINTSWIGMLPYTGPVYVPSWMEIAMSLTVFTVLVVLFGLAVKYLPVFPEEASGGGRGA